MPGERLLEFTRDNIPQMNLPTATPTSKRTPIRAERNAINNRCMPGERPLVFTRDNIPQTDLLIILTGEGISIRADTRCSKSPVYAR